MLTLKLASKTHDKNFFCQWWLWQPFFLSEPITAKLFEIQIWRQTNSQSESWMTTGWSQGVKPNNNNLTWNRQTS